MVMEVQSGAGGAVGATLVARAKPDGHTLGMAISALTINAAIQRRHPDSLLNWTERIIRMRKEVPEIGWGDFAVIATKDPAVLAMRYDWRNNSVLFVHNLADTPREVHFKVGLPDGSGEQLINLLIF